MNGLLSERREQLRLAALRLLQRREHSRWELERKLSRKQGRQVPAQDMAGVSDLDACELPAVDGLLRELLDELEAANLQSDQRFAASLLQSRCERGYGPLWIRAELQQRGVAAGLIDAVLNEAGVDWSVVLHDLHQRRFGSRQTDGPAEFQRRKRFLLNRGFPAEMVHRVCRAPEAFCSD